MSAVLPDLLCCKPRTAQRKRCRGKCHKGVQKWNVPVLVFCLVALIHMPDDHFHLSVIAYLILHLAVDPV